MADHMKVTVYLRASEVRALKRAGHEEPAEWVRNLVRRAIERTLEQAEKEMVER